jgi:alpha-glucosidase
MDNHPTYSSPEVFYGGIPFWYGLRNGKAYGIFFDDTSWGEIDLGATDPSYLSFENNGGEVDYYFFYGPEIPKILNKYTLLTGRPFMPPKWACGYQQCRWSYTPQSQVLGIASEFRTRNIPCDVIYLDIDYMPGGVALEFNPSTFPDPAGMISTLHGQGFRVVANISPFIFMHDSKYGTANSLGYFIQEPGGGTKTGWHNYWYFVGGAASGSMSWVDFSITAARNWWKSQHTSFLNYGIDGIWNDLNEPDELGGTWAADTPYNFDGSPVDHEDTSTQYCLLQTDSSYDTLADHSANTRPFVLSRGAYAGIQRSSAVWTGDNTSNWDHIARNIPMGLSMSISGQPHNGHDIGGFFNYPTYDSKPPGELFARWMQWGVFTGFVRAHHDGYSNGVSNPPYVEPWEFGITVENICRDAIGLRYRLMPYVYSLYHEAHTTGAPLQRPLVYDFPADAVTVNRNYDFMFGPNMLVAPVITQGAVTKAAYLPSGTGWSDYWTDSHYAGGQTVTVSAPLDRIPIFVPDGAIIPMGPVMQYANEFTPDEITVEIWPSTMPTSFTLYEDDGTTFDYQSGDYAETTFTQNFDGTTFTCDVSPRAGSFDPGTRHWLVKIHRWNDPVTAITVDGGDLTEYLSLAALQSAGTGYYVDALAGIVYARFADTALARSLLINDVPAVSSWHVY